jgi:hypothetical protein
MPPQTAASTEDVLNEPHCGHADILREQILSQ